MQINLLPEQLKKRKTAQAYLDFKRLILSFVFAWLILGILWLIFVLTINGYKRKLSGIEAEWKNTQPVLEERTYLIQYGRSLNAFLAFLKEHIKKGIFWSEKLIALSELVSEEIWFNEISLRKETKEGQENMFLDISASVGYLKSDEAMLNKINDFIEQIKKDRVFFKDFDILSLIDINKAMGKERFMNFRFSLSLKNRER